MSLSDQVKSPSWTISNDRLDPVINREQGKDFILSQIGGNNMIGAAVGAVANGITSAIQGAKQRKFQREMLEKEQAFSREMWQKQADYNSPVNQRKMLEEAGYNAQLMQAGNAGYASSSAPSPTVSGTYQPMPAGQAMSDASSQIISATTAKRGQDIELFTELTKALNQAEGIRNQNARWQAQSYIEGQLQKLANNQFEVMAVESQARIGKMAAEASLMKMQEKKIPYDIANQTSQVLIQALNGASMRALNDAKIKTEDQYREYLYSQTVGQGIINVLNERGVPEAEAAAKYWRDHPDELNQYIEDIIDMPYYNMFWNNWSNATGGFSELFEIFGKKKGKTR